MPTAMEKLLAMRREAIKRIEAKFKAPIRITVGSATCENAAGAGAVYDRFQELLNASNNKDIVIGRVGCTGRCDQEPVVTVLAQGKAPIKYMRVTPEKAEKIFNEHILNGKIVEEFAMKPACGDFNCVEANPLCTDCVAWGEQPIANRSFPIFGDVPFFAKQVRNVLRNCGVIDPESIDEYLAVRGYEAAAKALTSMKPQEIVDEVLKSGLRGRGGAGFPTGKKWSFVSGNPDPNKFIVCNADEGDPGAFMDRSTIEGDPHTILEGLIIAGYAIQAQQGYIYIRAEYPLAVERLEKAIKAAREAGFLGKGIFGTDWNFDIEIRLGAGAFVCGEETALIHSIEGKRGMPRPRPPFPAVSGLWGKPTIINNVETLANVPVVILDGADKFASIGTETSKGTKVFALAGKVCNTGLIEVPMGMTLREVIYGIGGGIKDGKKFKAVQTGGPAGGCLPESYLDTPVDYDSLMKAGSIMGSGGMIVIDEGNCMVDVAKFFLDFTKSESCGKCTPCREGTKIMLDILAKISKGQGTEEDVERLAELADTVQNTALCGLGQCAPNPVVSTLKYFREEYDAHVKDKKCPAGVCQDLISYSIDPEKCKGCTACSRKCPANCISGEVKKPHVINQQNCIKCGTCYSVCKFGAIVRG